MMMKSFIVSLILVFLLDDVTCEVIVQNVSVCYNTTAVLSCTTVTSTGILVWISGGQNIPYIQPSNVALGPQTLNNIYETRLTDVSNMGMNFTSTATTINPVTEEMSLMCSDGVISRTAFIHIIDTVPLIVDITPISSNHARITWVPPSNDTLNCITGYYIDRNGVRLPGDPITGTSATVPVIANSNYKFVVVAIDTFNNESSSDEYKFPFFEPQLTITSLKLNSMCDLNVSWMYPNREFPFNQSLFISGDNVDISNVMRSLSFSFKEKGTITLNVINVVGNNSVSLDFDFSDTILNACRTDNTTISSPTPTSTVSSTTIPTLLPSTPGMSPTTTSMLLPTQSTTTGNNTSTQAVLIALTGIFGVISVLSTAIFIILCIVLCICPKESNQQKLQNDKFPDKSSESNL